jgi:choline dehydrogenase
MTPRETYDYVVIGAGSAGCVLAARLSEDPDVSVLVLEAGGPGGHILAKMPLAHTRVRRLKGYDWGYESEPQPGLDGRRTLLPRGRALGGTSTVNGVMYQRGNARDYDVWRQMGLEGWSYREVLPYFKRIEHHWAGEGPYHGGAGPIGVELLDSPILMFEALAASAEAAGHPVNRDPSGESQDGISRTELTSSNGVRDSAARAYLVPAMGRANLDVLTHALTSRIVLDKTRAVGVEYVKDRRTYRVRAEREVLLCAGAYGSPQILMLSGIGPADHLREVGIDPVLDLAGVGRNLSEHPIVHLIYKATHRDTLLKHLRYDRASLGVLRWYLFGTGPFVNNGAYANIFLKSRADLERPDFQVICSAIALESNLWFPGLTAPAVHQYMTSPSLVRPESRGWVRLGSSDPAAAPRIQLNLLGERADVEAMLRAVEVTRDIYAREPQSRYIERALRPGPEVRTKADMAAFLRRTTGQGQHPVGTCAMGIGAAAVTDAQLRVRGVEGLRVVDASVMPEVPGGNTNIPAIMVAEKASDMICGRSEAPAAPEVGEAA